MEKSFINQEAQESGGSVLFKLADLDLDALLTQYITDCKYGDYIDYEVYKNYSLSRESWIDFIEVKVKPPEAKSPEDVICKYFGLVVLQGYLCSLDEVNDPERLYFELYLEDVLSSSMVKSLKYDYLMMQKENETAENDENQKDEINQKSKPVQEIDENKKEESKNDKESNKTEMIEDEEELVPVSKYLI